jgi:multidrug efflux pump subunit AcrA (membrane-fusion protein)
MSLPSEDASAPANPLGFVPGSPCFRAILVAGILLTAVGLVWLMAVFRPKSTFRAPEERIREIRVCEVRKTPQRATYLGYGTVRPVREVDDAERLVLLEQDAALAERHLARLRDLAARDASSATLAEQAEQAFLQRRNSLVTLRSQVVQIPAERAELTARHAVAAARERIALLDLARCRILAPFAGRVGKLTVEAGQYVNVGQGLLRLSDDRELEIPVSVDAVDALRLGLSGGVGDHANWLQGVERLQAEVAWVDAPVPGSRPAQVVRVADVDAATRTVVLIVQPRDTAAAEVPLVAGMFCRVRFLGGEIPDAVLLPRSAIQFGDRFYRVEEGRLKGMFPAILQRNEEGFLVDGAGLSTGALVVSEKLPFGIIEGMQVRPVPTASSGEAEAAAEPEP